MGEREKQEMEIEMIEIVLIYDVINWFIVTLGIINKLINLTIVANKNYFDHSNWPKTRSLAWFNFRLNR